MSKLSEWKTEAIGTKLHDFFRSKRGRITVMVCGAVGIVLLAFPELFARNRSQAVQSTSAEAFIAQTEEKLAAIVGSIQGAGKCCVMITLENGVEYVYATEQKTNTDRQEDNGKESNKVIQRDDNEESVIVIDTDVGRQGLLVTEIQPTVKGVVVVCEGGDNEKVRERIVSAVTVALNIAEKRVCVTKLS